MKHGLPWWASSGEPVREETEEEKEMNRDGDPGSTIDLAVLLIIALGITALLIMMPFVVHAAPCKTNLEQEIPPGAVIGSNDGDTFGIFWLGHGVMRIRVQGIDTPEKPKKGTVSDGRWAAASQFTKEWLLRAPFMLKTCFAMTLNRYVAVIERDGATLADALRQAGHEK